MKKRGGKKVSKKAKKAVTRKPSVKVAAKHVTHAPVKTKEEKPVKLRWAHLVAGIIWIFLVASVVYLLVVDHAEKKSTTVSDIIQEKITIDGREFIFSKGENVKNAPIIIFLHGGAQDDNVWFSENDQALIVKSALERGYAVIAPDSLVPLCENEKQWDYRENSTDFAFFDEIFNYIWSRDDLDSDRIYVAGISIGGFMASRLAEHYGDLIDAIAIHSGGNADNLYLDPVGLCYVEYYYDRTTIRPDHPRTLLIHGDNDSTIPIEASLKYYGALKDAGRGVKLIVKEDGEHNWYPEYNDEILDWFS